VDNVITVEKHKNWSACSLASRGRTMVCGCSGVTWLHDCFGTPLTWESTSHDTRRR